MKIAVYPGTFDPITYGHIDVISKSLIEAELSFLKFVKLELFQFLLREIGM